MIVFEDVISNIIKQIPADSEGFKPKFHWGGQDELNRYIALKSQPYPLIWMMEGLEKHDLKGYVSKDARFIIATRELKVERLNDVRLRESFDKVLNPLLDRLVEGFRKSQTTDLNLDIQVSKYPNYSEKEKNKTIDLWDAIVLDCTIRANNKCQNTIKWQ